MNDDAIKLLHKFQERGYLCVPDIREIKHPETDVIKYHLERRLQKLTLQVGQDCNLRCSYCIYGGKYENRPHAKKRMSFETAQKAIDYVLDRSIDSEMVNYGFYGGEPLLELELIKRCVSYIKEKSANRTITYTITTNGTLLTCDVYKWLVENDFNIIISLDGPKPVHDSARKYPDGRGSFDDIIENIVNIQIKYPDAKNKLRFLAVASPEISDSCVEKFYSMEDIFPEYGIQLNFVSDQYTEESMIYSDNLLVFNCVSLR